ncbi:unnamed protein product [Trichobilharzia regenti]|nr:unnamed protein product [Trichobilharzia regenti]
MKVVRLTALDFSNLPPQLSQHSPSDEHRQNCQQQECQFQSPGLSRSIGAGKKSSTYTKRLTRHFRHENMILNRSYMVSCYFLFKIVFQLFFFQVLVYCKDLNCFQFNHGMTSVTERERELVSWLAHFRRSLTIADLFWPAI